MGLLSRILRNRSSTIGNRGKLVLKYPFRFKFLHFVSGFFKSEWAGTKVKIPGNKVWGFDLSNNTITVFLTEKDKLQHQQAYNRPRLQIEIPEKACRYAKCVDQTDV
jgi:hypothetical protein